MRTPAQVQWDFVQEWLRKADSDMQAAKLLAESELPDYEVAAFHAQQAVEKAIKALLVRHQVEFGKTHDLKALTELIRPKESALADRLAGAAELTPYAVEYRYPGAMSSVDQAGARRVVGLATRAWERLRETLAEYLHAGRPGEEAD